MFSLASFAQFKSQVENEPSASRSLIHPATSINSFLGILNPENFTMHHALSFSYLSAGGTGLSLASYTNTMLYKIADPLNVRFDITLQGSPFGNYSGLQQNDLSKVFLSRAELNYRPLENMFIQLQYREIPFNNYSYFDRYSPYNSSLMFGDN
jgi:hypothetical protein